MYKKVATWEHDCLYKNRQTSAELIRAGETKRKNQIGERNLLVLNKAKKLDC